ncbi:MAG: aminotransferase class V-fold PLP-dependent enzyme [Candidatus Dojkabacteria bacterium]
MAEHHSNLIPLQQLTQESGASLQFVGVEQEDYNLDYASLENILANEGNKVKAIVLSAVSNVLGYKLDLCRVIELRNKYCEEAILAIDAAQLVGHEPFFPKDLGLDFVYFSAHKALGPMGIGVLWGRKEHLEKMSPIQFGGGMISRVQADRSDWNAVPARFEAGTPNVAGAVALAAALDYLLNIGLSNIKQYLSELTDYLYENLANRDDILIHCPNNSQTRGALLSFSHRKLHPHDLAQALDEYKVAVRAGQHCTQILHEEVLRLPGTVRTSLHVYNSQADINRLIQALDESETIRALS